MAARPLDPALYAAVKRDVYSTHPKHSAYRSGMLVREYKRRGGRYAAGKPRSSTGLARWFKERWVDACEWQHGRVKPCGRGGATRRTRKYPYCRPTVRVSSATPTTVDKLTAAEIRRNCRTKHREKGRVRALVRRRQRVCIRPSSSPSRRWMAVFYDRHERPTRRVHFGSAHRLHSRLDYTTGATAADRERYIHRHRGRGRWGKSGMHTPGFWSRWLLWENKKMRTAVRQLAVRLHDTHDIRMCPLNRARLSM